MAPSPDAVAQVVDAALDVASTTSSSSTPTGTGRARMQADDRRRQLVDIGWELLQNRPIHELALDEVAAQAGISRTLLFHYFPTKADFYLAVVGAAADHLLKPPRVPQGAGPRERVQSLVAGFIRLVERNRASYTTLVRGAGGGDQRVVALMAQTRDALVPRWLDAAECTEANALARLVVRGWLVGMEETVLAWDPAAVSREDLTEHLTASFLSELALAEGVADR